MLWNYVKTSLRHLYRNLSHSLINILGLTLGISCSLLILLWVVNEKSYDQFHKNPERLFRLLANNQPTDGDVQTQSEIPRNVRELIPLHIPEAQEVTQVYQSERWPGELCFKRKEKETQACIYHKGIYADDNFFDTFTFGIVRGNKNPFTSPESVAISETLANRLFPNEDPIGQSLLVDNFLEIKVAAVFEKIATNSTLQFDFVLPFSSFRKLRGISNEEYWQEHPFETFLRTDQSIHPQELASKINESILSSDWKQSGISFMIQPFVDTHLYSKFENGIATGGKITYVKIFTITGVLITLIACINFINLTTARAATRNKEVGVRKTTGASRLHLILQFMVESFILVLISLILSVGVVEIALPSFTKLTGENLVLNLWSGIFPYLLFGILFGVSFLAGIYPAFVLSSFEPARVLKNKTEGVFSGIALRKFLSIIQLSSAIVMLIFTFTLFMQLKMIQNFDLGFDKENVIRINPTYNLMKKLEAFQNELTSHASILNTGASNGDLINLEYQTDEVVWPGKEKNEKLFVREMVCGSGFLETMNIEIIEGRLFNNQDTSMLKVILSQEAVRQMNLEDPIGKQIEIYGETAEVVGVSSDIYGQSLHQSVEPVVFIYESNPMRLSAIYVRYQPGSTRDSFEKISDVYSQFEPDFRMTYMFQDEKFNNQYNTETITGNLSVLFTVMALGITLLGIIGLASFNILKRIREIGIRKVFGASTFKIVYLIIKEFTLLIFISSILAWPAGWLISNSWLENFAYKISIPWWVYIGSILLVFGLILVPIIKQALKAAGINPARILQSE